MITMASTAVNAAAALFEPQVLCNLSGGLIVKQKADQYDPAMRYMNPEKPVALQSFFAPESAPFLEIRTTHNSVLPYAEHFHSDFSLGLILEGSTCFFLDGIRHTAETGDIVLIAPGQTHCCNPVGGTPRSYHMLFIDWEWFQKQIWPDSEERKSMSIYRPVLRDAALFSAATALVDAAREGSTGIACTLAVLLMTMCRRGCFRPAAPEKKRTRRMPVRGDLLMPQAAPLGDRMTSSVSLLAQAAGMRRESFSRAVRRARGLPPNACLHCLRLELGRRLLRSGKSIAEAALAAGYADQSHFHRMFVRYFAATPGCYRKNR